MIGNGSSRSYEMQTSDVEVPVGIDFFECFGMIWK